MQFQFRFVIVNVVPRETHDAPILLLVLIREGHNRHDTDSFTSWKMDGDLILAGNGFVNEITAPDQCATHAKAYQRMEKSVDETYQHDDVRW